MLYFIGDVHCVTHMPSLLTGCVAHDDSILEFDRGEALIFVRCEAPIFVRDNNY
jgi:hypothetical protein